MQPQINFSGSACWHQNPIKFYKPCNCFRNGTGRERDLTSSSATVACPWAQLKLKVAPCGRHSGALRGPPGLLNNNNAVNYSWMGVGCIKRVGTTAGGGECEWECKPSELEAKVFPNSPKKFSLWIYLTIRSHKALPLPSPLPLFLSPSLSVCESEKSLHNNNEMLALKYSSYATLYKLHML